MTTTTRLTTRQIQRICTRHGWHCQMTRETHIVGVDARIVRDRHYRKSNCVKVAQTGGWQFLGWRWDVEVLSEQQIVKLLKSLEQSHNNESTGLCSTTGTQA